MADEQATSTDYMFWRGMARLNAGKFSHEVNSRVFLDGSPKKDLRIETANDLGFAALNLINEDQISIDIPGVAEPIALLMSGAKINSEGENVLTFGAKRSPIWTVKSQEMRSGRTMLINFAHYGLRAPQHLGFELNGTGWRARVIPISDDTLAVPVTMHSDEYRVTHQVEFAREDCGAFTPQEAQDLSRIYITSYPFAVADGSLHRFPSLSIVRERLGWSNGAQGRSVPGVIRRAGSTNIMVIQFGSSSSRSARSSLTRHGGMPCPMSCTGFNVRKLTPRAQTGAAYCCRHRWNDLHGICSFARKSHFPKGHSISFQPPLDCD